VQILVLIGISVFDLGPMYATGTSEASSLNAPAYGGGAIIKNNLQTVTTVNLHYEPLNIS